MIVSMKDDQFNELLKRIDSLDKRFAEQDASISRQLRNFKASEDDKYMKLFTYLRSEMATVHAEIKAIDLKMDSVHALGDVIAKEHEDDHVERLAMNHQLDRHERWHHQAVARAWVCSSTADAKEHAKRPSVPAPPDQLAAAAPLSPAVARRRCR